MRSRQLAARIAGMYVKVLRFWRSVSPASLPRALWLLLHHLRLPAVLEEQWAALLEVLRELLLFQPLATTEMHTQVRWPAAWPATRAWGACAVLAGAHCDGVPACCWHP